jgi:hypothetical protein
MSKPEFAQRLMTEVARMLDADPPIAYRLPPAARKEKKHGD